MNKVVAKWTGEYPTLCFGEWQLYINDKDCSNKIPEDIRKKEMNTEKDYNVYYLDEDYDDHWTEIFRGLSCEEWIKENDYWLNTITKDKDVKREIFKAINKEDWVHNSCGGCI